MLRKRQTHETEKEEEKPMSKVKPKKKSSKLFIKLLGIVIFVVYIVIPLSIYYCPTIRRHAVFLHYVRLSSEIDLSQPGQRGLNCTRNFYLESGDNIRLGVWHIPSASSMPRCQNGLIPEGKEFIDGRPVFLYLHGNAGSRSGRHRVFLYQLLSQKLDAHVIAFDYRGYGDSTNVSPTEAGLVEDTQAVYKWLLKSVKSSRIFIWGHSLGTGVSVAFMQKLSSDQPAGLILEAPFTSIKDTAKYHPISIFHRYMPYFEELIAAPIGDKDTGFDSISRINHVQCPLLILHAEDDGFVPFEHGKKLYDAAVKVRKGLPSHATQFVGFEAKFDFGHKNIYKSPELPNIIKQFMDKIKPKRSAA